ncbi:MAG: DUF2127 domain-containing protein [bacterium]|nr:DUF2127 domain-containing protein [bacterium]
MREKRWHLLFDIGLVAKAVVGTVEILSGSLFLLSSRFTINNFLIYLASAELFEEPNGDLVSFIAVYLRDLSISTQLFIAVYILLHGLINIFLVVGLYQEKLWTYLGALYFMAAFVVYQVFRLVQTHSLWLAFISILDCGFMIIIWHEYIYHRDLLKDTDLAKL